MRLIAIIALATASVGCGSNFDMRASDGRWLRDLRETEKDSQREMNEAEARYKANLQDERARARYLEALARWHMVRDARREAE
jgi:hypothetical protein